MNIGTSDLGNFKPDFVLYMKNGDVNNCVSSAVIKIDGMQLFGTSDFSQKVVSLSTGITGLTASSVLEVELRSSPGSFVQLVRR